MFGSIGPFKGSTLGTDNTIWLKAKRNLAVFLDTLICNLCLVRVYAFVPREISLLQGQNLSLRCSTSSVQSMQEDVENPQETPRRQASANASWSSQSSIARWPHAENFGATLRPYPSRLESAFSSRLAILRIATSCFARAKRSLGFDFGRTLLPLSRERLGLVCDGSQAVPSESSHLPRPCAAGGQREYARLVSGFHNHSCLHTQTHPSLGLRRDFGNYQARHHPGLDRSALPFPSHQPLAELPRTAKPQVGWQSPARKALSAYTPSSRDPRRSPFEHRPQRAPAFDSPCKTVACCAHDCSRVYPKGRPFQSLSEISKTKSPDHYRQRRSHEPKNS